MWTRDTVYPMSMPFARKRLKLSSIKHLKPLIECSLTIQMVSRMLTCARSHMK